jgi:hypothetical protein
VQLASGHRRRGSRSGRDRLLHSVSILVCALLVLGQIFATLHFALVPHRLCVLHGIEDVHGEREIDPLALERRTVDRQVQAPAAVEDSGGGCLLASLLHDRVALPPPAPATLSEPPASDGTFTILEEGAARPLRTLVLLAPKQGPPA